MPHNYGRNTSDRFMLQRFVNGKWSDVFLVDKRSATPRCRAFTQKLGVSHRVINLDKANAVLVECSPK